MRTGAICRCLALLAVLWPAQSFAQREAVQHEQSAVPLESRYQMVQSTLTARSTFRVDKVLGRVDQIVMRADSTLAWQPIPRRQHPDGDPQVAGRVNYQIFLSGLAVRHTFLMNVNNGATWQLVVGGDGALAWDPIT